MGSKLSYYSHRLMRHTDGKGHYWVDIREVYFDDEGNITAWTADPDAPGGEDVQDCQGEYTRMGDAFDHPMLAEWKLPGYDGPLPKEDG